MSGVIHRKDLSRVLNLLGLPSIGPGVGDVFFLCDSTLGNYYKWVKKEGVYSDHLFTDLPTAYAALTDQQNDVLIVMPGSHYQSAAFTWAKSNCFVYGAGPAIQEAPRSKILTLSTVTVTPLITIGGNANVFENIKFEQAGNHATLAAVDCLLTGIYNKFDHVHFQGGTGALSAADASMRSLVIRAGGNIFEDCAIGVDTVPRTAANYELDFDGVGGGARAPRNIFRRCQIRRYTTGSGNGGGFMNIAANGIDRFLLFSDCEFFNWPTALTQAFNIATGQNGYVILKNTSIIGATNLETSDSGALYGDNVPGAATTGKLVALTW